MTLDTQFNRARRSVVAALAAATLLDSRASATQNASLAVSLEQARADHLAGRVVLIDIREPDEHATGVAAGARLLPMRQLKARLAEVPKEIGKPVLLICNTQNRSKAVTEALREIGYGHVHYVHGGMSEWARRGWPMAKPGD